MYSAYKLNKQGDNIQPWRTPFPIWNQSVVPCPVLTVASWRAYRFLRRQGQVVWCSTLAKTVKLGVRRGGGKGSEVMLRVLETEDSDGAALPHWLLLLPWFPLQTCSPTSRMLPIWRTKRQPTAVFLPGKSHFVANRWGINGNSNRLYLLGLQNHCRWWLQPWN